jgi:3-isopropylmalate/(R)-2-methylmalate dehydratase large subunit
MTGATLIDKIWRDHVVIGEEGEPDLLYIDLHLIHEASSPQAFDGLRLAGRVVRRPDLTLAMEDHNVPTNTLELNEPLGREMVESLRRNCEHHGIELFRLGDRRQGIVHVVAPEQGFVLPGMTVICGDSHTSTHGAFGALAFGVGTSDVEHVLATQTLPLPKPRSMRVEFMGDLPQGVTSKDLILALIAKIGANGANSHIIEYCGTAISRLSMEARMTMCNMTIEAGARAGLIAPDDTTFEYLSRTPHAPRGRAWERAMTAWRKLPSDHDDALFDNAVTFNASLLSPFVTWGTNPGQAAPIDGVVPDPSSFSDQRERSAAARSLEYMALEPGRPIASIEIDTVFIGSCTNGRIEDLRAAAEILKGRKVAESVTMIVVPGSMEVRRQAENENLHEVFLAAGAQWRLSGCSMCLGMNPDRLNGRKRCVSTSNRNYEARQGPQVMTHLASPAVAAASAITGCLTAPATIGM